MAAHEDRPAVVTHVGNPDHVSLLQQDQSRGVTGIRLHHRVARVCHGETLQNHFVVPEYYVPVFVTQVVVMDLEKRKKL